MNRIVLLLVAIGAVGIAAPAMVVFALLFVSSIGHHSRPHGHQDMTFDIAPADDRLVFNATGTGGRDLYLLRLNDLSVTRLAETPDYEVTPSISPDGKWIVYAAGKPGDRADHLFIRPLDGGPARQLTFADANDTTPQFSPDGALIVFTRDKTYNWGGLAANWSDAGVICTITVDGTNERELTDEALFAYGPHFSRDGKSVLFVVDRGLFSIASDGSQPPTRLGPAPGIQLTYSADGEHRAYSQGKYAPDYQIYLENADGTGKLPLTSMGSCFVPQFTHAGDRVIFFYEDWPNGPTGHPKRTLWTVDADGRNTRSITNNLLFDDPLSWKPPAQP